MTSFLGVGPLPAKISWIRPWQMPHFGMWSASFQCLFRTCNTVVWPQDVCWPLCTCDKCQIYLQWQISHYYWWRRLLVSIDAKWPLICICWLTLINPSPSFKISKLQVEIPYFTSKNNKNSKSNFSKSWVVFPFEMFTIMLSMSMHLFTFLYTLSILVQIKKIEWK
jgi:hypothetical protein